MLSSSSACLECPASIFYVAIRHDDAIAKILLRYLSDSLGRCFYCGSYACDQDSTDFIIRLASVS